MEATNTRLFLNEHRKIWQQKPVLREIYREYFDLIRDACIPGPILEIGGGSGNFKDFAPESISMDIIPLPWLDVVADAQQLPFQDGSISNIVMVDVLHHIESLLAFLRETDRVLGPGGRLIFIEPVITPISRIFLNLFHPEPIDMRQNPLDERAANPARKPFDANQAIPTLLVGRYRTNFAKGFPRLKFVKVKYLNIITYPLSGGFRPWCLIPQWCLPYLLWIEKRIVPVVGHLMAFRLYCVIEKGKISVTAEEICGSQDTEKAAEAP
jgi:SAM-dependent methyltransferase